MADPGDAAKGAAWDRLTARSARFRRVQSRHSAVWGAALLGECVARVIGAFTLPVDTMVWLGTVMLVVAIVVATVVSGMVGIQTMARMLAAEAADTATAPARSVSAAPAGTAAR
ncbi:hypothetical protein [Streptomyces sp. Ac-502]|uniref:hypothetical protein n=1 Tax=Streptomyces sp. Ac-502 TaxID=3342801 RepID=UPI003862A371